ncbi:hypothetical protein FE257_012243 [Aspergillus nanangensis]|uniref:F-box domain-containing protein n=1 Tax=Aspergillus nanangensis TaxID=2582783 RepID=A0AAD4GQU5_ASPNN|nr:hypothetical protein FE257_012243 [Aspergillus nanangensis]
MQPEPSAVFGQTPLFNPSHEEFSNLTQHGHDSCGDRRAPDLRVEGRGSDPVPGSSENGDSSPLNAIIPDQGISSSPSVDRVSQYERTMAQSPRRQRDMEFVVSASSIPPRISLEAFPNEVLTHILSHLPPPTLSSIALVSRRFHSLVTTPHAWRIAFSRYFPGPYTTEVEGRLYGADHLENFASDKRYFSRLTALASWRSEYILRTRLLRSLARGKPTQFEPSKKTGTVRSASLRNGSAVVTYTSQLLFPVSHIHGSFGSEVTKKQPLFIHGASEQGISSASDPSSVKVGTWGLSDHQLFRHFADYFPGDAQYGLGSGNMVGLPNQMDVSQPFGMVYGEGCPQGRAYFISTYEQRGRFLGITETGAQHQLGIPIMNPITTAISAVWIAKSTHILKMTGGLVGMLSGTSSGVLTAYALGPHPAYENRYERGQLTARWVICPGVPIVAIAVDDNYSPKRHSGRRVWAVALNALGEVFYICDLPTVPTILSTKMTQEEMDILAWNTGRTVAWELLELSRRTARPDPYSREPVDGSYSPRSSSDSMKLNKDQLAAETKEIEQFMAFKPKHFRKVCEGWNMRRELQVDFAGDDGHSAGESIVMIARGVGEYEKASIRRYTRKVSKLDIHQSLSGPIPRFDDKVPASSIFGGSQDSPTPSLPLSRASGHLSNPVCTANNTEWRISDFLFGDLKSMQVTATALDLSTYALLTPDEDPLLGMSGSSAESSVMSSPLPHMKQTSSHLEIPGQRGRYIAVGTATGVILVWDIRAPTSKSSEVINSINPVRIIQTESPQVSCLALTSLFLVHGGNDGLVQAWDPLASTTRPIRTLNSRFSSRARRRLVQAEASLNGVGNNFYATGAISLDPDPTVLRGMVALGTHVRYWSYSSTAADQYKTSKRRLRRGLRGGNAGPEGQRFTSSGRGALLDHIEDEKIEMERQEVEDEKERFHLSNRFGVDLLGPDATEEQIIAYAQLLSEEALANDVGKRDESAANSVASTSSGDTIGRNDSSFAPDELSSSSSPYEEPMDDDLAPDIAEAIRLSLLDEGPVQLDPVTEVPIKYSKEFLKNHGDFSLSETVTAPESSRQQELDDLEFAIQLSLAESESHRQESAEEHLEYPSLTPISSSRVEDNGKGKGRAL